MRAQVKCVSEVCGFEFFTKDIEIVCPLCGREAHVSEQPSPTLDWLTAKEARELLWRICASYSVTVRENLCPWRDSCGYGFSHQGWSVAHHKGFPIYAEPPAEAKLCHWLFQCCRRVHTYSQRAQEET